MSGFEIVGVVLGGLPVALKALEACGTCWKEINGLYHHAEEVSKFYRDLDMECTLFANTCQNLFDQNISASVVEGLVSPTSTPEEKEKWSSSQVKQILESKLRPKTFKLFLQNVNEMNSLINDLSAKYPKEPPSHEKKGSLYRYSHNVRKTLKFRTLKTFHESKLERARIINNNLQKLAKDGGCTEKDVTKLQTTKAMKFYYAVHRNSVRLYNILREKLEKPGCTCHLPHDTALQLEVQDVTKAADSQEHSELEKDRWNGGLRLQFRAFIKMELGGNTEIWQGIDIESVSVESSDNDPQGTEKDNCSGVSISEISSPILTIPATSTDTPNRPRSPLMQSVRETVKKRIKHVRFGSSSSTNLITLENGAADSTTTNRSKGDIINLSSTGSTTMIETAQSITTSSSMSTVTPIIDVLCKHLLQSYGSQEVSHAAFLTSPCTPFARLRISPTPASKLLKSLVSSSSDCLFQRTVTLHELLQRTRPAEKLSLKTRLQLAVRLAYSVLQFHPSDWINEEWSSQDIVFLQGSNGQVVLDTPLASRPLRNSMHSGDPSISPAPSTSPTSDSANLPSWCNTNKTLLSLGIVLIELWKLRRFEEYESDAMDTGISDISAEKAKAMDRLERRIRLAICLSDELKDNAGTEYESAIRRCVRGLGHAESTLNSKGYKEAVYAGVVVPLKDVLEKTFPEVIN